MTKGHEGQPMTPPDTNDAVPKPSEGAKQDTATMLSLLPPAGAEDDIGRLMIAYEVVERQYRAAMRTTVRNIGSSASTNG